MNVVALLLLSSYVIIFVSVGVFGDDLGLQPVAALNSEVDSFGHESKSDVLPLRATVVSKRVAEFTDQFIKQDELSLSSDADVLQGDVEDLQVTTAPASQTDDIEAVENSTLNNTDNGLNRSTLVSCIVGNSSIGKPVELINSTRLLNLLVSDTNVTRRRQPAECVMILFYARYCPFSSLAAPHFNALPRAFPDIKMAAIDAMKYHSFNTQYGIVGVPTVMLFHNGRPAAKFNNSDYTLEMFGRFIMEYTGLEPINKLFVMSVDFSGPVPSVPVKETDYCLVLSWVFIMLCAVYYFSKSAWWQWIVEAVQNSWREAEAHHEHVE